MSHADVLERLGKSDGTRFSGAVYPGLDIAFTHDTVVTISLTDSTVSTARDLRIGDAKEKMVRLYGIRETGSPMYQYFIAEGTTDERCLNVGIWEGRVSHIFIGTCRQGE